MWRMMGYNVEKGIAYNSFPHKSIVIHRQTPTTQTNYIFLYVLVLLKIGIRNKWNLIIIISKSKFKINGDVEKKIFFFQ